MLVRYRGEIELLVEALLCDNVGVYDAKQMGYQYDSSSEKLFRLRMTKYHYEYLQS